MAEFRAGVPVELEAIVIRCLQKDPEKRYATIAALAQALQPFAPLEARASVARITRMLGAASRRRAGDSSSSGTNEERVTTAPSWEGDTKLQTFAPFMRRRVPRLLGGAALVIAAGALFVARRAKEPGSPVPDPTHAAPGAGSETASVRGSSLPIAAPATAPAVPSTAPSVSPLLPSSAPSIALSAPDAGPASGARLTGARIRVPSNRPKAVAGASAGSHEPSEDGTADRK
jgi:serine/threonine-protein kinase